MHIGKVIVLGTNNFFNSQDEMGTRCRCFHLADKSSRKKNGKNGKLHYVQH